MTPFVAVTDSPAGSDLVIERQVLSSVRIEHVPMEPQHVLIEAVRDADGILCMHAQLNREVINSLRECRVIARYGTGLDNIDLAAAQDARIPVSGVGDYCTGEVADHTMALLLAWARKLPAYHDFVMERRWNERTQSTGNWGCGPVTRLSTMTLGLLGFGRIGKAVAQRARAFGMPVLAWARHPNPTAAEALGVELVTRDDLLRRSDYISLHVPLTVTTRHMIDAEAIAMMKEGAVLINTARGGLVDEMELVKALRSRHLAAGLLDVHQETPLPIGHPLRSMDNVILTPHVAFYSEEALRDLRSLAAEAIRKYLF